MEIDTDKEIDEIAQKIVNILLNSTDLTSEDFKNAVVKEIEYLAKNCYEQGHATGVIIGNRIDEALNKNNEF